MLGHVIPLAAKQGYTPEINVTSDLTNGIGRPNPDMLLYAMDKMGVEGPHSVIKVGDTVNDILEGKAAHAITVGVVEGGNLIGLTEDEYNSLSIAKQNSLKNRAITILENAGADYVIDNLQDLINLISAIDTDQNMSHNRHQFY